MHDAKEVTTSMSTTTLFALMDDTNLTNATKYRQTIGSLKYLFLTYPNISFTVNKLSQFTNKPAGTH